MFPPHGPLPPRVYWRRRAFAVGASFLAVVVLAMVIGRLVGTEDDRPVPVGEVGAGPHTPPPSSPAASPPTATPPTTSPAESPAAPRPTVPPGPPKACPDSVIKVAASTGTSRYRVGDRPVLRLLVTNAGKVTCVRDVSRELRELVIMSADGRERLWSSQDCYGPPEEQRRMLAPEKPLEFELRWAGRTSAPGCPANRRTVPPGSYQLIGKLGTLTGTPTPLVLAG